MANLELETLKTENLALQKKCADLEADHKAMREALEYIADIHGHRQGGFLYDTDPKRARECLEGLRVKG